MSRSTTTLYQPSSLGRIPSPRGIEPLGLTGAPGPARALGRALMARDVLVFGFLVLAGLAVLLVVVGPERSAAIVRSTLVIAALVGLPFLGTVTSTFRAVSAAERRTAPDDRPAPARSLRRHAVAWSVGAGSAAMAWALLAGLVAPVPAALAVTASVVVGNEVGIALGRNRSRALLAITISTCTGVVVAMVVLSSSVVEPLTLVSVATSVGCAVGVLVGRLTLRDTRPGVPVWVPHGSAVPSTLHHGGIALLVAWAPLISVVGPSPEAAVAAALVLTALPLAAIAFGLSTSMATPTSGLRADLRGAARRWRAPVVIVSLLLGVASSIAIAVAVNAWPAGLVAGALTGAGAFLLCYSGAQGDPRGPLAAMTCGVAALALALLPPAAAVAGQAAVGGVALALGVVLVSTYVEVSRPDDAREALPQLSTDPYASTMPLWSRHGLVDVTIVVPFLNPDPDQLVAHLQSIHDGLSEAGHSFEIIAVDDGSTNGAARRVELLPWRGLSVVRHSRNRGKGGAVATGFMHAHGRLVGFIDADGDIDAGHLAVYVNAALESDADIVLADKTHARSSNGSAAGRQVTSSVMHGVNRHLLRLSIVDTQTGAKLLRRELVQSSLPRMWENGFAFDVELFVVAQHLGYQRLLSMPVTIQREGGSTVSLKSTLRTGLRVLVIARRIAMADYYYGARSWPAEIDERVSDTSERRANAMTIPEQAQPGRVPAPRAASHGRSE